MVPLLGTGYGAVDDDEGVIKYGDFNIAQTTIAVDNDIAANVCDRVYDT